MPIVSVRYRPVWHVKLGGRVMPCCQRRAVATFGPGRQPSNRAACRFLVSQLQGVRIQWLRNPSRNLAYRPAFAEGKVMVSRLRQPTRTATKPCNALSASSVNLSFLSSLTSSSLCFEETSATRRQKSKDGYLARACRAKPYKLSPEPAKMPGLLRDCTNWSLRDSALR